MTGLLPAAALAACLSAIFVRLLASPRLGAWAMDRPNERSLHERPTPRTGGAGLLLAAAVSWAVMGAGAYTGLVVLAGLLMLLSLADDAGGLPVLVRFAAQTAAAAALLVMEAPPPVLAPLLLLSVLWMTNLYNFMDGSDGLAGGMAVSGFLGYALLAGLADAEGLAVLAAAVAGAALGFLLWNFSPAIVFMGDSGSVPLGFLAAAIGIAGWTRGIWPLSLPALLFAPFIADATFTLLRRLAAGENVLKAHRTHFYQRLIQSGRSHRQVALLAYALMGVLVLAALAMRTLEPGLHMALTLAIGLGLAGVFAVAGRNLPPVPAPRQAAGGGKT